MGEANRKREISEGQMRAVSKALQSVAGDLDKQLARIAGGKVAFSLFVWTNGRASYVSTANRADVIAVLEGMIAGWKAGMPDIPAHEIEG